MARTMQHHIKPVAEDLGIPLKGYHSLCHSYTLLRRMATIQKLSRICGGMRRTTSPRTLNDAAVSEEKREAHCGVLATCNPYRNPYHGGRW